MTRILLVVLIVLLLVGLLATSALAKPACGWPHRGAPPPQCRRAPVLPTPTPTLSNCRVEPWYCG